MWNSRVRFADAYPEGEFDTLRQHIALVAVLRLFFNSAISLPVFPLTDVLPLISVGHPVLELHQFAFALITLTGAPICIATFPARTRSLQMEGCFSLLFYRLQVLR